MRTNNEYIMKKIILHMYIYVHDRVQRSNAGQYHIKNIGLLRAQYGKILTAVDERGLVSGMSAITWRVINSCHYLS